MYTMNNHPFKVGDKVVVVRRVLDEDGWNNVWTGQMNELIGNQTEYEIAEITGQGIRFYGFGWPAGSLDFPYETKVIDTID